jgi:methionyl-tRNA formyltransferase
MINSSKTIIFFGSGPVAASSLEFLAHHFTIETVITKAKASYHKHSAPVEELAKTLDLPIRYANNSQELDNIFSPNSFNSRLGIVVDYGVIISEKVIKSFKLGIVNSHFSLLPQWRGADPITFSILSGQEKTGVSLMVIDQYLDTGKLIIQKELNINPDETVISLTHKLIELSNDLLLEYIPAYFDGQINLFEQPNQDSATYSRKISKEDGFIDPTKPAQQIERQIRAFLGWPGSKIVYKGKNIIIKKAHVTDKAETKLDILCSDGKYLSIDELIAPSGKKMSPNAFLNGHY